MTDINIDQLQKEIQEAEGYLLSDSSKQRSGNRSSSPVVLRFSNNNSSAEISNKNSTPSSSGSNNNSLSSTELPHSNRYSDPAEREQLISRLLKEHNQRNSSNSNSGSDSEQNNNNNNTTGNILYDNSSSNDAEQTIFFASEFASASQDNNFGTIDYNNTSSSKSNFFDSVTPQLSNPVGSTRDTDYSNSGNREDISMMETVRFTKPLDSNIRTVDNSNYSRSSITMTDNIKSKFNSSMDSTAMDDSDYAEAMFAPDEESSPYNNDVPNADTLPTCDKTNSKDNSKEQDPLNQTTLFKRKDSRLQSNGYNSRSNSRLRSREALQKEAEKEFRKTHSFQPTLYTRPKPREKAKDTENASPSIRNTQKINNANRISFSELSNKQQSQQQSNKSRTVTPRRIEELYRSNKNRVQDRELQKQQLEKLELERCTFKPKIAPGSKRILQHKEEMEQLEEDIDYYRTTGKLPQQSSDNRSRPNTSRAKSKSPQRNNRSRTPTRSSKGTPEARTPDHEKKTPVTERLYQEAQEKAAQMQWMRQQVQAARDAEYTFQPCLNPFGKSPSTGDDHVPLHERLADIQRERKEYLHALRASVEEEQARNFTFQPSVTPQSKKLAEKRRYFGGPYSKEYFNPVENESNSLRMSGEREAEIVLNFDEDVGSRLFNQGHVMARRKQMQQHENDVRVAESMTPAPISDGSQKILNNKHIDNMTFEMRQQHYENAQKKKQMERIMDSEYEQSNWFKPALTKKSIQIVSEKRPELNIESDEMRVERLSQQEAEAREARRRQRAAEIYGSIPFKPQIDPLSKALGRTSSVEELADNTRGRMIREQSRQRIEEERNREYTYQPKINELSKQLLQSGDDDVRKYYEEFAQIGWGECGMSRMDNGSSSSVCSTHSRYNRINMKEPEKMTRDIRIHMLEKEEMRRSELIAREIEELRECTFHPSIEQSMSGLERSKRETGPVIVRGLGRHLELAQLREKQKFEARQREKEVFSVPNVDKFRRAEDGSTIVQEFNFQTANLSNRHSNHNNSISASVVFGKGAGRAASGNATTSLAGSPELQQDFLQYPTSHHNKHGSDSSFVWCY